MDTAISDGTNANFDVGSHWPRDGRYPTYEAFDGCQARQTRVAEPETPCAPANAEAPAPDQFEAIRGELCIWREPYNLPPDFVVADQLENQCWGLMEAWNHTGTWQRQSFAGHPVVDARIVDFEDPAEGDALDRVLEQCDLLYAQAGRTPIFEDLLQLSACDGTARLVEEVIEPIVPDQGGVVAGPEAEPDACD